MFFKHKRMLMQATVNALSVLGNQWTNSLKAVQANWKQKQQQHKINNDKHKQTTFYI